jgi:hypothetical protein
MVVGRHRVSHVEKPIQDLATIARAHRTRAAKAIRDELAAQAKAARDEVEAQAKAARDEREVLAKAQREQAIADLVEDDDLAYVSFRPIVRRLREVDDIVGRSLAASGQAGQHTATAALSGQALRVIETRAKLGGHAGYHSLSADPGSGRPKFSVSIYFSSGHQETITATSVDSSSAPEIDADECE